MIIRTMQACSTTSALGVVCCMPTLDEPVAEGSAPARFDKCPPQTLKRSVSEAAVQCQSAGPYRRHGVTRHSNRLMTVHAYWRSCRTPGTGKALFEAQSTSRQAPWPRTRLIDNMPMLRAYR
jgi:hypothetical protein